MMKPSKTIWFAAIAVATACHVAPAGAQETFTIDGYKCYINKYVLQNRVRYTPHNQPGSDITLQQCLAVCDKTPGCVAVNWDLHGNAQHYCYLEFKNTSLHTYWGREGDVAIACIKQHKTYKRGDKPDDVMEIPRKIPPPPYREEPGRPTPQPGPPPSGRR